MATVEAESCSVLHKVGAEMVGTFALVFAGCGAIIVDRLSGGAGDDKIRGGTGDDRLAGGDGNDVSLLAVGVAAIPEPSTALLSAIGLLALLRRKR